MCGGKRQQIAGNMPKIIRMARQQNALPPVYAGRQCRRSSTLVGKEERTRHIAPLHTQPLQKYVPLCAEEAH